MKIITKEQLARKSLKNLIMTSFCRIALSLQPPLHMDRANNLSANQLPKDEFFG